MAEITSTGTLPPGAPAPTTGPSWSVGQFDSLPLPDGGTVGRCSNEDLRRILNRLGIAEAHTAGRNVLCGRYSELLNKIRTDAGSAAIADFLAKHRG